MARAAAKPRTRSTIIEELEPDNDIVADAMNEANLERTPYDELVALFGKLNQTMGDDDLVVVLMTRDHRGAKWSRLESFRSAVKEFDPETTIDYVEQKHGPGEYKFMINIAGRAYKHLEFMLGDPRKKVEIISKDNNNDMMAVMLQMSQQARESAERAAERQAAAQTAMITALIGAAGVIVPALVGNRTPPTDPTTIMANLAGVMKSLMPEQKPDTNNLRETVETLALVKGLFDKGESTDTILGTVKEVAPQLLGTISETLQSWRNRPPTGTMPPSSLQPQIGQQPQQFEPPLRDDTQLNADTTVEVTDPILKLIAEDVRYFATKNKDAQIAAEFIAAQLEEAGVTYEQIQELVRKHILSANWLESLAADGLDLRAFQPWAEQFLQELTAIFEERKSELDSGASDTGRQEGSEGNA